MPAHYHADNNLDVVLAAYDGVGQAAFPLASCLRIWLQISSYEERERVGGEGLHQERKVFLPECSLTTRKVSKKSLSSFVQEKYTHHFRLQSHDNSCRGHTQKESHEPQSSLCNFNSPVGTNSLLVSVMTCEACTVLTVYTIT